MEERGETSTSFLLMTFNTTQSIDYTSSRGGVSVVEERGETSTSFLLLQNAQAVDSGSFSCQPENMEETEVRLHVLDGESLLLLLKMARKPGKKQKENPVVCTGEGKR